MTEVKGLELVNEAEAATLLVKTNGGKVFRLSRPVPGPHPVGDWWVAQLNWANEYDGNGPAGLLSSYVGGGGHDYNVAACRELATDLRGLVSLPS